MADQTPNLADLRNALKRLREAPLLSKPAHAEHAVALTLRVLESQDARIAVLERDVLELATLTRAAALSLRNRHG